MSIDLGWRLRYVREQAGLSQRELAKRTDVANSTIARIEKDQMDPSVSALKRILDEIPIGMTEFFSLKTRKSK